MCGVIFYKLKTEKKRKEKKKENHEYLEVTISLTFINKFLCIIIYAII